MEEIFKKGDPVIIVQDFNSGPRTGSNDGKFALFDTYDIKKDTKSAGYTCEVHAYEPGWDQLKTGVVVFKIRRATSSEIPSRFKELQINNSYEIF